MTNENTIVGEEPEIVAADPEPEAATEAETEAEETADEDAPGGDGAEVDGDDAEADDDGESDDDDGDEIELNIAGNPRKFGKKQTAGEVAAELQKFADETWQAHTRRSQEVAERDKSLKARAESLDKIQQMDDEAFKLFAAAKSYDETASTLRQKLAQTDRYNNPDQYRFISDDIAQYQAAAQQARTALGQREQMAEQARLAEVQRRQQEGAALVKRQIKDFDPDKVVDYVAKNYGIDAKRAKETWGLDPAVAMMADKAMRWDQMQERARKSKAPPAKQPEPVRTKARKGGAVRKSYETMSPEEFDRVRRKERAAHAAKRLR